MPSGWLLLLYHMAYAKRGQESSKVQELRVEPVILAAVRFTYAYCQRAKEIMSELWAQNTIYQRCSKLRGFALSHGLNVHNILLNQLVCPLAKVLACGHYFAQFFDQLHATQIWKSFRFCFGQAIQKETMPTRGQDPMQDVVYL